MIHHLCFLSSQVMVTHLKAAIKGNISATDLFLQFCSYFMCYYLSYTQHHIFKDIAMILLR